MPVARRVMFHHGAYLFSTTTGSVELDTQEQTKAFNLGWIMQSMQDAEYNLRRIPLPRTSVNKGAVREVEFHSCLSLVHGARG